MPLNQNESLADRGVVIVGGANGIGAVVAKGFLDSGANVVTIDMSGPAEQWPEGKEPARVLADITSHDSVLGAFAEVDSYLPHVDVLINTVGISGADTPSELLSESEWRKVIDVNLTGVFFCCQQAGQRMIANGSGTIVNFSSLAGVQVAKHYRTVHYHSAKAALLTMTGALAAEWGPKGIRVNCIAPGAHATAAVKGIWGDDPARIEQQYAKIRAATPLRRIGQPEELVPLTLFLASDDSAYITGQTIIADGGRGLEFD
jgi:NAD(P)-dependent dehydrogenase (short-subunit alcohol dehydrogenase family)